MNVALIAVSQPTIFVPDSDPQRRLTAEELIVYCARVSNPSNQLNLDTGHKLLHYCIRHGHWSVFETVSMTVEIQTSRAIAAQILRHRSFSFQEFSQRYAVAAGGSEPIELRWKGGTNRQGSGGLSQDPEADALVAESIAKAEETYAALIDAGVAPECARFVLPLATKTTLYMTGSVRSWIHYLQQRLSLHAQKEHRSVAQVIGSIFADQFPITWAAVNDTTPSL
ncbi:MAG: FAD-dependent thymidylate synthase [Verrucomicrobia bacterium]|nr:FAD-dependent thymidylate synthase [Verrucomicrobiota bacterium]